MGRILRINKADTFIKKPGGKRLIQFSRMIPAEMMTTMNKIVDLRPNLYNSIRDYVIIAIEAQINADIQWLEFNLGIKINREEE